MWLLAEETLRSMQRAEKLGLLPTAEQQAQHEARCLAQIEARDGLPPNMSIAGDTAEIRVEGVLTKKPSLWSQLFGGGNTAYRDIIGALSFATNDPSIRSVSFTVDSPGGHVDGLFDSLSAIQAFPKPMRVGRASNAQSAAYAIAAAAGPIEATGPSATFGSLGVAIDFMFFSDMELVSLTNTDSPDKRPNPRTPEGQAVIVRHLDALNDLFVDAIAGGRGVSSSTVRGSFGRGATLLAAEAKRLGMIDTIANAKPALRVVRGSAPEGGGQEEQTKMDLKTLKAQHPDVYEAAVKEGVAQERDRVGAHLTMGEQAGEDGLKVAFAAIKNGDAMTQTLQAQYLATALNRRDRSLRQTETDEAGAAADGANAPVGGGQDMGDVVAAKLAEKRGKKLVAHG
jgi:ClpP class serine protease